MHKKLRIGIDIDGCVTCPTALVPFLQKSFDQNLKYEDITEYDLGKVLNQPDDIIQQWFKDYQEEIYRTSPVHKDADKVLNEWAKAFHLIFISARYEFLNEITLNWFKEHNIPFHHIELTGSHNKLEACKKLEVDYFIEDKLDNAIDIHHELNIPVFLFDTPYNQSELPKGVTRVFDWQSLNQKFIQMIQK